MSYKPIQCEIYDYIEIACMRHYALEIMMHTNETIKGTALTTQIINKEEFLVLTLANKTDKSTQAIRLDKIQQITALDKKASFETVTIS